MSIFFHWAAISVWISAAFKVLRYCQQQRETKTLTASLKQLSSPHYSLQSMTWRASWRSSMQPANWLVLPLTTYLSSSSQLWHGRHTSWHMMPCSQCSRWPALVMLYHTLSTSLSVCLSVCLYDSGTGTPLENFFWTLVLLHFKGVNLAFYTTIFIWPL